MDDNYAESIAKSLKKLAGVMNDIELHLARISGELAAMNETLLTISERDGE